jgi:sporulation protein YlmC with PRC-barrel domain
VSHRFNVVGELQALRYCRKCGTPRVLREKRDRVTGIRHATLVGAFFALRDAKGAQAAMACTIDGVEGKVDTNLRYLNASRVDSPVGALSQMDVATVDGEQIGDVDGVLIDPAARCVRFYVIAARRRWLGRRRYLLPADQPALLERDGRVLRFEIDETALKSCQEFRNQEVPEFSDMDLVSAIFAKTA